MHKLPTFYKTVEKPVESTSNFWKWTKKITKTVLLIIAITASIYTGIQLTKVSKQIITNWSVLQFAYNKPTVVKEIQKDYETKSKKLDQSYININTDKLQSTASANITR